MGADFAEKYPKVASRLLLEPTRCEDPHVERLIEAAAFLSARVHLKIDDEFPEIPDALLTVLYPHYIRPIPSMTVAQLHLDPDQGKLAGGLPIPRASMLYSRPVEGYPCKFRTCYDPILWPLSIAEAQWLTPDRLRPAIKAADAVAAFRVEFNCLPDADFSKMQLRSLRFYLNGESSLVHALYELLCNNTTQILIRDLAPNSRKPPVMIPAGSLRPVGFEDEEALLPYHRHSFSGYRLLQEYFSFPEKFFFLDLIGLEVLERAGFGPRVEIIFLISNFERAERGQMLELNVSAKTLCLGCSPVINLFPLTAEPILLDQTDFEYPVVPDVRRRHALEIFYIEEVISPDRDPHQVLQFEPFYRFRHASSRQEKRQQAFWYASRRPSRRSNDEGTEVFLCLMDLTGRPMRPDVDTVTVHCTCSNRDLPYRLPLGNEAGDFELEGLGAVKRIVALRKPTATVRPPTGKGVRARLLSPLSLHCWSLVAAGKDRLTERLRLARFRESSAPISAAAGLAVMR